MSPEPVGAPAASGARPLREIARGDKIELEALRAFLRSTSNSVSHPGAMPAPELSEDQIRQVSMYLMSLGAAK